MKTLSDLNALIPVITQLLKAQKHDIGGDGEWTENYFCYDEDGWMVEVEYRCCGDWLTDRGDRWNPPYSELISAKGCPVEIRARHCDYDTDEETVFSGEDIDALWAAVEEALERI